MDRIKCELCEKEFEPKNYWQKFCSKKCKMLSWAKRELKKIKKVSVIFLILSFASACYADQLKASWYSEASLIKEGTRKIGERMVMANGEQFDETKLTCATRLYPFGTLLQITNQENGKSIIVKVTDRIGKRFATTRIDLSKMAFSKLDKLEKGIIPITVEVLQ